MKCRDQCLQADQEINGRHHYQILFNLAPLVLFNINSTIKKKNKKKTVRLKLLHAVSQQISCCHRPKCCSWPMTKMQLKCDWKVTKCDSFIHYTKWIKSSVGKVPANSTWHQYFWQVKLIHALLLQAPSVNSSGYHSFWFVYVNVLCCTGQKKCLCATSVTYATSSAQGITLKTHQRMCYIQI